MKKGNFKELIIYEDNDYIVINKPPYISSLDDRHDPENIKKWAKEYSSDAQVCHRLDKETSGALSIAKNPEAYRKMAMQFEDREVTKIYHAVVDGVHELEGISVYMPILPLKNGIVKLDTRLGKEAETIFNTLRAFKRNTLVECMPITGRMHQIRIHLSYLKAPITGDTQYGGTDLYLSDIKKRFNLREEEQERPIMQRVALHAYSLKFKLKDDKDLTVKAPYPKDFAVLLKQLEKYSS